MLHRGHESTGDTGGGELAVPMAWLYAEYIADELLRTGDLMPPTSFEFRAGRDALALTVFLSDTEGELSCVRVVSQLETWMSLTAYDQPWQDWVRDRLTELTAEAVRSGAPSPDLALAGTRGAGWRRPSCSRPIWTRCRAAVRCPGRTTGPRCGRRRGSSDCRSGTSPSICSDASRSAVPAPRRPPFRRLAVARSGL